MGYLTISQVEKILRWSYPTALKFAQEHGELIEGKWYIPFDDVSSEVQRRMVRAQKMQRDLVALANPN